MMRGLVASASIVTPPEEVKPMNAAAMWVLPLSGTVGRLT